MNKLSCVFVLMFLVYEVPVLGDLKQDLVQLMHKKRDELKEEDRIGRKRKLLFEMCALAKFVGELERLEEEEKEEFKAIQNRVLYFQMKRERIDKKDSGRSSNQDSETSEIVAINEAIKS